MEQFKREDIESMLEAAFWPDQNGLTPLLRAFQTCNMSTATILCSVSPEAARISDANGQTFWHLLVKQPIGLLCLPPSSESSIKRTVGINRQER